MKIVIKVGTGVLTRENGTLDGSSIVHLVSALAGLMRLRQICCHPGLVDPKYAKEDSAKMTALFYLLDQYFLRQMMR